VIKASSQKPLAPRVLPEKFIVSVVIPAYNAAEFLGEALDSVLAQTYQPLEVIVVDDGSEDESPQVVATYADKVTYIQKERAGPASARNIGIRASSGEWVAFLDADDLWMPTLLEKLVKKAVQTGADLAFSDWVPLVNGSVIGPSNLERSGVKARLDTLASNGVLVNPFKLLLEVGCYFSPSSVLVRKDSLLEIGLLDESIYGTEDLDLWLRLSLRYRFAALNEVLSLRRIHGRNISRDTWSLNANEIKTFEKLERHAPTAAPGTRWRKLLRKRMVPMLREQGAGYLERGQIPLARKSWAKGFRRSYSPRLAAYWLATFLPRSCVEVLRNLKRQALFALGYRF
jgi:glycosyltransferase involved in cell wall biosynthesis